MSKYYAYVRVSTTKQGEGVSLKEQKDAIDSYARKEGLEVDRWFEEKQTAARKGRPEFNEMVDLLRKGEADGVIIHKVDRGSRNLKDWAKIGDLIDEGIDVHFAAESLDLDSRGGRLSADIQAVVAADYIRNLREEVKKGFYGRLKQGLYPLPAPTGYKDKGGGEPKEIDPVKGPLVKKAFKLYSTGQYSLEELKEKMTDMGLTNRRGDQISTSALSRMLNNPFYMGIIRIKKTDETFEGVHEPLVPASLYERVQKVLEGKRQETKQKHDFLFRKLFSCSYCQYSLIGEEQKGYVYYRCHNSDCPTVSIRQDRLNDAVLEKLDQITFSEEEVEYFENKIREMRDDWEEDRTSQRESLQLQLEKANSRLKRLTDAYLDETIEEELFKTRKEELLKKRKQLEEKLSDLEEKSPELPNKMERFLELAKSARSSYKRAIKEERRSLVKTVTSNREVDEENPVIELKEPFRTVANRRNSSCGAPCRGAPRTVEGLFVRVSKILSRESIAEP